VALDDPAIVGGARRAKDVRRCSARAVVVRRAQQATDGTDRVDEPLLAGVVERGEQLFDERVGVAIELPEGGAARGGERDVALASVVRRAGAPDEPSSLEPLEQPAQVSRVEPQLAPECRRRWRVAMRELEEHASLGEREGTVEVAALVERADEAGIEPIEPTHGGNAGDGRRGGSGAR
jgi:hypothetical protein